MSTRQIPSAHGNSAPYSIHTQEMRVCVNVCGQSRPAGRVTYYTSFSQHLSPLEAKGEMSRAPGSFGELCEREGGAGGRGVRGVEERAPLPALLPAGVLCSPDPKGRPCRAIPMMSWRSVCLEALVWESQDLGLDLDFDTD